MFRSEDVSLDAIFEWADDGAGFDCDPTDPTGAFICSRPLRHVRPLITAWLTRREAAALQPTWPS